MTLHVEMPVAKGGRCVLREVHINWRKALSSYFPTTAELDRGVVPPASPDQNSVYIDPATVEMPALRSWMNEHMSRSQYAMFGRFEMRVYQYRTERARTMLRFNFKDARDAIYFKLRWG